MDVNVTIKFIINNICEADECMDMTGCDNQAEAVHVLTKQLIEEEGLFGVVDYDSYELLSVMEKE